MWEVRGEVQRKRGRVITTTITVSGLYTRGPFLAPTFCRHTVTGEWEWRLQWYYTDGRGGRRFSPSIPGHAYRTKKAAAEAKRKLLAEGARP